MKTLRQDLVILVADSDMKGFVESLLSRHSDLGIRQVDWKLYVHPDHDPACLLRSHDFLRPFSQDYDHALVMFDRRGCGREQEKRRGLEKTVAQSLARNGWDDRAEAIVIDPELEQWIWNLSPEVSDCLGWRSSVSDLQQWLRERDAWSEAAPKPSDPKRALALVLKQVHRRPSPAIFSRLAQTVNFDHCSDGAFARFRQVLQEWFPLMAKGSR